MRAYNLFCRKIGRELYVAVPLDLVVPSFIDDRQWEYAGVIDQWSAPPNGFNLKVAAEGVRYNGFYLFQGF